MQWWLLDRGGALRRQAACEQGKRVGCGRSSRGGPRQRALPIDLPAARGPLGRLCEGARTYVVTVVQRYSLPTPHRVRDNFVADKVIGAQVIDNFGSDKVIGDNVISRR